VKKKPAGKRFDLGVRAELLLSMKDGSVATTKNQFLGVRDGILEVVGPWKAAYEKDCRKLIDGRGSLVMPGLINGHTHLAMTLFRGLEDDVPFHVWLFERILPLEAAFVSKRFVQDGTALAALESIRFGVTTVNEMYFYAKATAETWDAAGLRGIVSQTLADFPLPEDKDLGKDKFALVRDLTRRYAGHRRLEIGLGPHAPYSCSDELLRKVAEESAELGCPIHIHVSETAREVEESVEKFRETPVERLDRLGILKPRTLCAHCVHLGEKDREIFRRSGATAIYNPDSNMKLASGIAPVAAYQKNGTPWCFGTDGTASNNDLSLFDAMDIGTKLQKLGAGDTTALTAAQSLYAATLGGAKALGLGDKIGSLEEGKRADFILLGLDHPNLHPINDLASHLVYSVQGFEVHTTVCEGRVLMEKGKFLTLDKAKIFKSAEGWRKKIAAKLQEIR
jgi:5-methylthioadenosine/S-adenosylhomocysteine deaminase